MIAPSVEKTRRRHVKRGRAFLMRGRTLDEPQIAQIEEQRTRPSGADETERGAERLQPWQREAAGKMQMHGAQGRDVAARVFLDAVEQAVASPAAEHVAGERPHRFGVARIGAEKLIVLRADLTPVSDRINRVMYSPGTRSARSFAPRDGYNPAGCGASEDLSERCDRGRYNFPSALGRQRFAGQAPDGVRATCRRRKRMDR